MARDVLSLVYKEALNYFMSASNYSTLGLPEHLGHDFCVEACRKTIDSKHFKIAGVRAT